MKSKIELYAMNQVRRQRLAKGISQATLSFGIGVTRGFVGQVESENSSSKYNLNHLNDIAIFLECSMRDFFPERPL